MFLVVSVALVRLVAQDMVFRQVLELQPQHILVLAAVAAVLQTSQILMLVLVVAQAVILMQS
jgi:hypothetical protein